LPTLFQLIIKHSLLTTMLASLVSNVPEKRPRQYLRDAPPFAGEQMVCVIPKSA
jgi:hypothetical protein